jgi:transcriptional regulator of arginine metabolism
MKQGRQSTILEIIENHNVETQDQLSEILRSMGFEVTQATISRDIKELKLVKVQGEDGSYRYAVAGKGQLGKLDVFKRVFRETVVSVEQAASLVIVRTMTGSANAAAEAIDEMDMPEIAGSLAGDNTIFIAVKQEGMQKKVVEELGKMMRSKR